jgi:protein-S-isoprenylcysteine O-methyltransferase Ste14
MSSSAPAIVVTACWAVFVVTWAIAALFTKRTLERRWSWGTLLSVLAIVVAWRLMRHPQAFDTARLWEPTPALQWLAALVVIAGLVVTLWARAALGRNWSGTVTFKQDHELIVSGPYRFVRHPIYSGLLLMALGSGILSGWRSGFLAVAVLFVGFWLKLRVEERLMEQHFPEAYPDYRRRTRALIPFLL